MQQADSKSVKAAERGLAGRPDRVRCGQEGQGVKYHVLVDTLGLLLTVAVHAAKLQDRDGAALVLDHRTRVGVTY